jgi:MBG domain/IPT/TIG domain
MKKSHNRIWISALLALAVLPYAEAATIRMAGGEWQLGSQVVATNFVVDAGAQLNGTGTVYSAMTVRGSISPGTSLTDVATLSISSNLTFDGGQFLCYAAASNSLDLLIVAGTVSGVGTVAISRAGGALPDQEVIVQGAPSSDYNSFAASPAAGWLLGESGSLDLWIGSIPSMEILGTNGAAVASGEAADLVKGTKMDPALPGSVTIHTLSLTNNGNAALNIANVQTNGADASLFAISSLPASLPVDSAVTFTVTYSPIAPGSHSVSLVVSNNSPTNPYTLNLAGSCYAISTNNGPFMGGNTLTITNGNFGTITNVLIGSSSATIVGSGTSWVTLAMPATGSSGMKDITVQTSDNGDTILMGAYTVNPSGILNTVVPSSGSWTGGYPVVLSGTNFGNGSDVTNVTLCGFQVASIDSQSATQVVVTAGTGGAVGIGEVRLQSVSYGDTYNPNSFEYLRETQAALGFTPSTPQAYATTNPLSTTGGTGTGVVSYAVSSGPGLIVSGSNVTATAGSGNIILVATKAQDGFYYETATTATVVAVKANQAISFAPIPDQETTNQVGLSATSGSGLSVSFAVGSGSAVIAGGTNLSFTGDGNVSIVAAQGGDANWNAAPPVTNTFLVTKAMASVFLLDLAQTYDGTARTVTATSMPAGLTVEITYDGAATAPSNAATYAVTGTVNDVIYQGVSTGSLVVAKADQTITFTGIADQLTTNEVGLAATASSSLPVSFAVASGPAAIAGGTNLTFSTSGQVSIAASQAGNGDWNAAPDMTNLFQVTKTVAPVFLLDLAQVYDSTARTITATTMPAGLTVEFTYDSLSWAPTNAGSYAVTGTVNDLMYQGVSNGTLVVDRGVDTITFSATNQVYDGTARAVTAVAGSGSSVAVTYDGAVPAPVPVGIYAVTGIVDTANWMATNTTTLTVIKGDQVITNFLPPDGAQFILGASTSVSAQASSGLVVNFANLTPETTLMVGLSVTFTNSGLARVEATQAGDANWNAAPMLTNEWRIGGIITNVVPNAANVGGGIDVLIQGRWMGDGSDITNVTLAGVQATILTQTVNDVTVRAEAAPATVTGDVRVVSTTGGTMVLTNGFTYLWLDAPVQADPIDITPSNLVARWQPVPAATTHFMDVALDTNFMAYHPGYDNLDVAMVEQYPVEGLSDGVWYAIRLFAWNTNGYSWPSRTVWVPATTNTPYETHPPQPGPVSQGAIMQQPLSNMFYGADIIFTASSSDSNVIWTAISAGGDLELDPRNPGQALITIWANNPVTGYTCSYSFLVNVVGEPTILSQDFLPREMWNPRFTQLLQVRNDSGLDAIGIRVLFSDLEEGITIENQTGTSADGRPMIEMETAFTNGATLDLNVVYLCMGAYRVDLYPATVELQYILPEWIPPLPGEGTVIGNGFPLSGGRYLLQFDSIIGRLYAIEYRNNFPSGEWVEVPLRLRATANRTQWIDAGPPATQPPEGLRIYRVKELAE